MCNTKLILACFLLLGPGLDAHALDIKVGGRPINLPLPAGFVELTPAMSPYDFCSAIHGIAQRHAKSD